MERQRVVLAVLLMLLVWFLPMVIWPPKPKPAAGRLSGSADSAALRDSVARANAPSQPAAQPLTPPPPRRRYRSHDLGYLAALSPRLQHARRHAQHRRAAQVPILRGA